MLEAIVALPLNLFYNTGIATAPTQGLRSSRHRHAPRKRARNSRVSERICETACVINFARFWKLPAGSSSCLDLGSTSLPLCYPAFSSPGR